MRGCCHFYAARNWQREAVSSYTTTGELNKEMVQSESKVSAIRYVGFGG